MVVSPLLRGMLGLSVDAKTDTVTFSPHVPADWRQFSVRNVRVGKSRLRLCYTAKPDSITLEADCVGDTPCNIAFKPAISLRARVASVASGPAESHRAIPFHVTANDDDQHVEIETKGSSKAVITIRLRDNFGVAYNPALPPLGSASQGLRILSQAWSAGHDVLTIEVAGAPGHSYDLDLSNSVQNAANRGTLYQVEGGQHFFQDGLDKIRIRFPDDDLGQYTHRKVVLHFMVLPTKGPQKAKP